MLNSFVFTVALRYFKAKKNEKFVSVISGFSLIGVMLGVAALIVVMSVMKGFHREFTKNIIGLNGDITITSYNKAIPDFDNIKKILLREDYIKNIIPSIVGQALALGVSKNSGSLIRGIGLEDLKQKKEIIQNVFSGQFTNFVGKNVVAIGSELAYVLGAKVGSKLKLISPHTISTTFGSMPRFKEFEVIAIFSSGMYDYDSMTILMPLEAAKNFFSLEKDINLIEINTAKSENAEFFAEKIQAIINPELKVMSWQNANSPFLNALAIEQVAMFTILSLIIVVAAFNIISSLFMLVKDKTKDIAILRTIGASQKEIMLIFIFNGMLIGTIGTIGGIGLGYGFAHNIDTIRNYLEKISGTKIFDAVIYFLYTLPSHVEAADVGLIGCLSLLLCFLATIYPSYKASKLNPVDALRYE